MSAPLSIFILGATGYIGGSVLSALLDSQPQATFVVQYRRDAHKEILLQFSSRIRPIKATLEDTDVLSHEAAKADVVVNCADVNHVSSIQALIAGLENGAKARADQNRPKAVLLHTSGTSELTDPNWPFGEFDPTVYDDTDLAQIQAMPETRWHRDVTNLVLAGIERGHFIGYVILPSCIYGPGTGPLNRISIQIPNIITHALEVKQAKYISPGTAVWNNVHIQPLSKLYALLLAHSLAHPSIPDNGCEHWVLANSAHGPHSWKEVTERVSQILKEMGELESGEAVGVKAPVKGMTDIGVGTNSVGMPRKAKLLVGWEDQQVIWEALRGDVEAVVRREKERARK